MRDVIAKSALEHMLLTEIRAHAGCEDVVSVEVMRLDDRFEVNWKVNSIGFGSHGSKMANRAAEHAQHKLQNRFILE
jgi:hypothetical protein